MSTVGVAIAPQSAAAAARLVPASTASSCDVAIAPDHTAAATLGMLWAAAMSYPESQLAVGPRPAAAVAAAAEKAKLVAEE